MRFNSVIKALINTAGHKFLHKKSDKYFKAFLSFSDINRDFSEIGRSVSDNYTLFMSSDADFVIKSGDIICDTLNDNERKFKVCDINSVSADNYDLYYILSLSLQKGAGDSCLHI